MFDTARDGIGALVGEGRRRGIVIVGRDGCEEVGRDGREEEEEEEEEAPGGGGEGDRRRGRPAREA